MQALSKGMLTAMLLVYVLLAVVFRSFIQPAIIMTAIPFGIVGAVLGHLLMGYSLSLISFFGIVALSGVVVNDALVLIDLANRKQLEGHNSYSRYCQCSGLPLSPHHPDNHDNLFRPSADDL